MKTNAIFVQQATVSPARATTTVTYTTTVCNCTVTGQNTSVKVVVDSGDTEKASVAIPTPGVNISACYGSKFLGYKFTVLPTAGTLKLGTVPVVVDQVVTKQDFSKLNYTVTANTAGSDSATYLLVADCGTSTALTIGFTLVAEAPEVDGE